MPLHRYLANKLLTAVENAALGTSASELHTGYRAYSHNFLATVPFLRNSNNFVFDTQLIAQAVAFSQRLVEVPIKTRYHPEASSTSMKANLGYGCATLLTMLLWRLHKAGLVRSKLFRR